MSSMRSVASTMRGVSNTQRFQSKINVLSLLSTNSNSLNNYRTVLTTTSTSYTKSSITSNITSSITTTQSRPFLSALIKKVPNPFRKETVHHKEGREFLAENKLKEGIISLPSGLQYRVIRSCDEYLAEKEAEADKDNKDKDNSNSSDSSSSDAFSAQSPLYSTSKLGHPLSYTPCVCHYEGRFLNNEIFDSSYQRGEGPITFAPNQVIAGWTEAMQLMCEGDKWELYVPYSLGYGDRGVGNVKDGGIPGGSCLIFVIEIVEILGATKPKKRGE